NVFAVEESNLSGSMIDSKFSANLWENLQIGYNQFFGAVKIQRNFREEIEALEARLFFRIKNIRMILKKGDRSKRQNYESAKLLFKNLNGKRLTLLNLRMDRARQHVVMAKSYKKVSSNLYEIKVYDSNSPTHDPSLFFHSDSLTFSAPEILRRFKDSNPNRDIGLFIVDEEDRVQFEQAMLDHYRERCR
ncbi:MAG: hypothetical protein ACXVCY_11060, partial [Pseudobdellovibrionaceae bacterium]